MKYFRFQKTKQFALLLLCLSQLHCAIRDEAMPLPPIRDFTVAGENEAWLITEKGKLFHFFNGGQTHEEVSFPIKVVQIYFLNSNEGWALGSDGQVWATSNGGNDWQKRAMLVEENPVFWSSQLVFADSQTGWLIGAFTVWMTENGGNSWNMVYPTTEFDYENLQAQPTFYFPTNANEGWMSMTNGKVLKTTSRGKMWENVSIPSNSDIRSVYAFSSSECFIPAFNGAEIYYTNNGGKNWQPTLNAPDKDNVGIFSIDFPTTKVGWAVGIEFVTNTNAVSKNVVLKTIDGGKNWVRQKNEFYKNPFNEIKFTDEQNGWLKGEKSLYHTANGGEEWTKIFEVSE